MALVNFRHLISLLGAHWLNALIVVFFFFFSQINQHTSQLVTCWHCVSHFSCEEHMGKKMCSNFLLCATSGKDIEIERERSDSNRLSKPRLHTSYRKVYRMLWCCRKLWNNLFWSAPQNEYKYGCER